jgi:ABC-2 type transport system permease protein
VDIDIEKLRWLLWLHWKMLTRRYTKNIVTIIGSVSLFIFIPFAGMIVAVATYLMYRLFPAPLNGEILFLVLVAIYILWVLLPMMEFTINEGLDVAKLALFPLTRGELMSSLIISTLLDIPTLGLFFVLVAVVMGWGTSPLLTVIDTLAMIIFYVQLVAASQLVLALFRRVLQSRRFRDISIIALVLLSSCGYICNLASQKLLTNHAASTFVSTSLTSYLQWTPPGMAARAVQQASVGHWGISCIWLVALLVLSLLFLLCWQLLVERGLTVAETARPVRSKAHQQRRAVAQDAPQRFQIVSLLPTPVRAILLKELKYFLRDPQIKAVFVQSIISNVFLIIYVGYSFLDTGSRSEFSIIAGRWGIFVAPLFVLFSLFSLSANLLGLERQSLMLLFIFPLKPTHLIAGKNIALFVVGIVEIVLVLIVFAIVSHGWELLALALLIGCVGLFITMGVGNLVSVYIPQRISPARNGLLARGSTSGAGSFLRIILMSISFGCLLVLMSPVAVAVFLPDYLHLQWLWWITLPLALGYGIALYGVVTLHAARRMVMKVPELLEIITKE